MMHVSKESTITNHVCVFVNVVESCDVFGIFEVKISDFLSYLVILLKQEELADKITPIILGEVFQGLICHYSCRRDQTLFRINPCDPRESRKISRLYNFFGMFG